jgi:hypothetical protein
MKMGTIDLKLAGNSAGEIRKNCRQINAQWSWCPRSPLHPQKIKELFCSLLQLHSKSWSKIWHKLLW